MKGSVWHFINIYNKNLHYYLILYNSFVLLYRITNDTYSYIECKVFKEKTY